MSINTYHKFICNGEIILIDGNYSVSAAHLQAQKTNKNAVYVGMTVKF